MEENIIPTQNQEKILTKQDIAQQKKQNFFILVNKIKKITFITVFLIILFVLVRLIFLKTKSTFTVITEEKPIEKKEEIGKKEEEPGKNAEDTWEKFSSTKYKFDISYPKNDLFSITEDANLIKIIFKDTLPESNVNWDTLVTGYYVIVNPLQISERNIDQAAVLKKDWYKNNCPGSAEFSVIQDIVISQAPGKKFLVTNCNSEINVIFAQKNNFIYEITSAIKGDMGFKQNYQSITQQIINSLNLYEEDKPTPDPFIVFDNKIYGVYFKYSRTLNSTCCTIPYPVPNVIGIEYLTYLSQSDKDHTLGVYYDANRNNIPYEVYLKNQINLLTDDFKIIMGYSPSGKIEEFEVNGQKVTKLINYYWRGTDIYYVKSSKGYGVLIFSMTDFSQSLFDEILSSLKFN